MSRLPRPKYAQVLPHNSGTATRGQLVAIHLLYLISSGQVAVASAKLEILRALKFYDVDSSMHTLIAEVDVCISRGDYEQVCVIYSLTNLEALAFVTQRFRDLNEQDADVGERLYLMSLHGRILLVLYIFCLSDLIETWNSCEGTFSADPMRGSL